MPTQLNAATRLLALKGPKGPKHTEPAKKKVEHPGKGPVTPKHMRIGSAEIDAAGFDSWSKERQEKYLAEHPNSKYNKGSGVGKKGTGDAWKDSVLREWDRDERRTKKAPAPAKKPAGKELEPPVRPKKTGDAWKDGVLMDNYREEKKAYDKQQRLKNKG